jgi:hypothetical protein
MARTSHQGPTVPPPRIPDATFRPVTVNDTPHWMWETEGGHGILVPRDSVAIQAQPDGTGTAVLPLTGHTFGVLNLRDQTGTDARGWLFPYTLTEGWPRA